MWDDSRTRRGTSMCARLAAQGTYQDKIGQHSCVTCQPGSYSDSEGRTSACELCGAGTYQPAYGATTGCMPCAAGKYQDTTGQDVCIQCGLGEYNPDPGQITCDIASQGFMVNFARTAQINCDSLAVGVQCTPATSAPSGAPSNAPSATPSNAPSNAPSTAPSADPSSDSNTLIIVVIATTSAIVFVSCTAFIYKKLNSTTEEDPGSFSSQPLSQQIKMFTVF